MPLRCIQRPESCYGYAARAERRRVVFILITLFLAFSPYLATGQLTTEAPPQTPARSLARDASQQLPNGPGDGPAYPIARPVPPADEPDDIVIVADTQTAKAGHFTLDGNVIITYGDRTVQADHMEYDQGTGDLQANGHLLAFGGHNQERIQASHGELNVNTQTGRFYDVTGSVGLKTVNKQTVYTNGNPFLFSGRLVVKTGPQNYDVYDGSVTSCMLPKPDWIFSAGHFSVDSNQARARNSTFRVLNLPVFYLPYVTHSVDGESRQSGFLIPIFGQSSTKGFILGEQIYFALGRSADLTVGAEYFSMRGFSQSATFRYRGRGDNFIRAHYSGLLDRRTGVGNQGGEDTILSGRRDLSASTRVVGDAEYLSSFVYRAAFTENFNQAVSSDIVSRLFITRNTHGFDITAITDRYQGLKRIQVTNADGSIIAGQQVRIFHAPSLNVSSVDRPLGHTGFTFSFDSSAAGLKRVQPNFQTAGIVQRLDLRPELSYRLAAGNWFFRPSVAVRETAYSRSRFTPTAANPITPVESADALNRADVEVKAELRAPVIERTFASGFLQRAFQHDFRHTIEPELTYRYVSGIDNFSNILRFDDRDIASNTNELEYGVTQRLFLRPRRNAPCAVPSEPIENPLRNTLPGGVTEGAGVADPIEEGCGSREWITWRVTQKYFFDPSFGGAIQNNRRNIFETTLNFSGIAFLTEQREISPLLSRLRVRASRHLDVEWDLDYDTGAKKLTASNLFLDAHQGVKFAALSFARLNAPGRAYSEGISLAVSDFSQMRILFGYGMPTKRGLSIAANAGLDLNVGAVQYAALQTSYNWDCCGVSVEYRKYELGSVRNENAYRFNFTLANVGSAGNLRRAERLF